MATSLVNLSLISGAKTYYKIRQQMVCGGYFGVGNQSGGCCCCWICPTGTQYVQFEVWGAGGDGAGSCCCEGPVQAPGNGQYVKKTVVTGTICPYYNICAAGSGCCSQCFNGNATGCGFPSFVTNSAGTVVACGAGGAGGCTYCGHMGGQSCYGNCCGGIMSCCNLCGDLCMGNIQNAGDHENNFCTQEHYPWKSGSIKYQPNSMFGSSSCAQPMTVAGCYYYAQQQIGFPGGPGSSGQACAGGCCWGQWGGAGLIVITYG